MIGHFLLGDESDELVKFSAEFDPAFENYLQEMYSSVNENFNPKSIHGAGLKAVKHIRESKKISMGLDQRADVTEKISAAIRAIIYKYGYGNALDNSLQDGFIYKKFLALVEAEAKKLQMTDAELLSALETNTQSIFIERAIKAEKIIGKTGEEQEIKDALSEAQKVLDNVHFLKQEEPLGQIVEKLSMENKQLLEKYVAEFREAYSPHSSAFKFLEFYQKHGISKGARHGKIEYLGDPHLLELYREIKKWIEISSTELHAAHMALYFNLFDKIHKDLNIDFDRSINTYVNVLRKKAVELGLKPFTLSI